jgi:hypothetical protein
LKEAAELMGSMEGQETSANKKYSTQFRIFDHWKKKETDVLTNAVEQSLF